MSSTIEQVRYINVHLVSGNKGNNTITELRTILQRESQNAYVYKQTTSVVMEKLNTMYKYIQLVYGSHKEFKYRNMRLISRTTEQIKERNVFGV